MTIKNSWVELSISVPNEFIDIISEFFFQSGVSSIQNIERENQKTTLITYLKNSKNIDKKIQKINYWLSDQFSEENILSSRKVIETDWIERTRDSFEPLKIGRRIWIQPSWDNQKTPDGRIKIVLDPGTSFGTGRHPTTKFALLSIENFLKKNVINHFLDIGCGSGILIVAALKLGAKNGTAFDIDPQAVENTRKLLRSNEVKKRAKVINETLHKKHLDSLFGQIDFIVANIFLDPLQKLFPLFAEVLNSEGILLITGITPKQCDNFSKICGDFDLKLSSKETQLNWAKMEFIKN